MVIIYIHIYIYIYTYNNGNVVLTSTRKRARTAHGFGMLGMWHSRVPRNQNIKVILGILRSFVYTETPNIYRNP